jgi:diguanylate cyclase (GGDEF)-like protein
VIQDRQTIFIKDVLPLFVKMMPEELVAFKQRIFNLMKVNVHSKSLILPLISENRPIGILNLYGEELLEIDQKAGEAFSGQISAALENAKLLAKVQQLAITDELTGILNRRGLFEHANLQYKSACRYKRDLSVLMIDIDNFKKINDTFGHDIGDQVLIELARRIKGNVRDIDILGRYGGEEFLILLAETDHSGSLIVGERIRALIDNTPFSTNSGTIHVTISIGIGFLKPDTQSFEQICKAADEALYIAKNRGKNQVAT